MGKIIGNIGTLDLTCAKDEAIAEIDKIHNVGTIIYSPETAHLITKLSIDNIGESCQITGDPKIINGTLEIDHAYCQENPKKISVFINGYVIVKPDVTPEDIEKNFGELFINGHLIYPKKLSHVTLAITKRINGHSIPYEDADKIFMDEMIWDETILESFEDDTSIAVLDDVIILNDMDPQLLEKKIKSLQVHGDVIVREKYSGIITQKLENSLDATVVVIPDDYEYITKNLVLDAVNIKKFKGAKIYTHKKIRFEDDITEEILREHIKAIKTENLMICHKKIYEALTEICEGKACKILHHSGKLIITDGMYKLTSSLLKYTSEKISLMVKGMCKIDKEIEPELLFEKLEFVDNFGQISVAGENYGVIQAKLRTNKGQLLHVDKKEGKPENKEKKEYSIKNVGYLKL